MYHLFVYIPYMSACLCHFADLSHCVYTVVAHAGAILCACVISMYSASVIIERRALASN